MKNIHLANNGLQTNVVHEVKTSMMAIGNRLRKSMSLIFAIFLSTLFLTELKAYGQDQSVETGIETEQISITEGEDIQFRFAVNSPDSMVTATIKIEELGSDGTTKDDTAYLGDKNGVSGTVANNCHSTDETFIQIADYASHQLCVGSNSSVQLFTLDDNSHEKHRKVKVSLIAVDRGTISKSSSSIVVLVENNDVPTIYIDNARHRSQKGRT